MSTQTLRLAIFISPRPIYVKAETAMTYTTQKNKQYQQKIDYLKLQKVEVTQRLNTINSSLERLNILLKQEKERTERMGLGVKNK